MTLDTNGTTRLVTLTAWDTYVGTSTIIVFHWQEEGKNGNLTQFKVKIDFCNDCIFFDVDAGMMSESLL